MKTITVNLGQRSYPIYIGAKVLEKSELLSTHIVGNRVAIITNKTVAPFYLDTVKANLAPYDPVVVILPDGERYKTLDVLMCIYDALLEAQCDRQTTLVALGGGVIGDLTGFAAATYMRGVPFIQVPTTLLAQVDSSVGGKTGVNHPQGKNMIGAFYQPVAVIIDTATLTTLPERELSAGIAEIIKYGLIRDVGFFEWLEKNIERLLSRDQEALIHTIARSCENKAAVVAADEREAGERALLNFGHTFGHAIEAGMGYGNWLHGEAIAVGMAMAAELSVCFGWLTEADAQRIKKLLTRAALPIESPPELSLTRFRELMAVDKKVIGGKPRFVLLKKIGDAVVTDKVTDDLLEQVLTHKASVV